MRPADWTSRSQAETGQDEFVAEHFGWKRGGTFVDVGAYDGEYLSNSCSLERHLGWVGVCVEPLPWASIAGRGNRRAHWVEAAAFSSDGMAEFCTDGVLSGVPEHIDRWPEVLSKPRITVRTRTLTSILDEWRLGAGPALRHFDYLSIDTEGSELEVLHGIDFDRYSFGFVSIEHNEMEPRRAEMRRYLEARGYSFLRANHWDDDYVRARLYG